MSDPTPEATERHVLMGRITITRLMREDRSECLELDSTEDLSIHDAVGMLTIAANNLMRDMYDD